MIDKLLSYFAITPAVLLLSACASSSGSKVSEVDVDTTKPMEVENFTTFPGILLLCNGKCSEASGKDYFAWNIKLSFDFDSQGNVRLAKKQEPALNDDDDPAMDSVCGENGSPGNQRNSWFPYTAFFVRGGEAISISDVDQKQLNLIRLIDIEGGQKMVVGEQARDIEWAYYPCVGPNQVESAYRLDGFLPSNSVMDLISDDGVSLHLSLPSPMEPFVLLRYRSGAIIPVPMRPVMITVDLFEHRLVVYYQSTFADVPPLRKIELRAILPGQTPEEDESPERFVERTEAMLGELRGCPAPVNPIEPCATPDRRPDMRIFSR
jgi:hypothetical protein